MTGELTSPSMCVCVCVCVCVFSEAFVGQKKNSLRGSLTEGLGIRFSLDWHQTLAYECYIMAVCECVAKNTDNIHRFTEEKNVVFQQVSADTML